MEILLIIVITIVILSLAVFLWYRFKIKSNNIEESKYAVVESATQYALPTIERITTLDELEKMHLSEIKDSEVISRISQAIPEISKIATGVDSNKALQNTYKVILPKGEQLVQSKEMKGAFRGIYRGAKGIKGHANFVKASTSNLAKASTLVNIGYSVGALVVGQHYMSEINSKLEKMNRDISKISDIQEKEFKSRIMSLVVLVMEISQFSVDIIENEEVRNQKLMALESMKENSTELLGQVNETITGISQSHHHPDFKTYQENVEDLNNLVGYQNILISMLSEISRLTYLLGRGRRSIEMCFSTYNTYLEYSIQTDNQLKLWHDEQVESLGIDLEKNRMSKSGIEGLVAQIPALVDEKWRYKPLNEGVAEKISNQAHIEHIAEIEQKAVYEEDVQVIIRDGKYYYSTKPVRET